MLKKEAGYTLIESMVVLMLTTIAAAVLVSGLYAGAAEAGGAEKVLEEASSRVIERRVEAVRLNSEDRRAGLETGTVPPLPINFANGATGSLRTDGTDQNDDCTDDHTNKRLTCLVLKEGQISWDLAFHEDTLKLPSGWNILTEPAANVGLPLIGAGTNGRGRPALAVAFGANGKAFGLEPGETDFRPYPTGSVVSETPNSTETPFWAIYFYVPLESRRRGVVRAAVAVAVYPSGLVEKFRLDGTTWIGFKNRTVGGTDEK